MSLYYIEEKDEMELSDVADAIEEAGFKVGALRIKQAIEKITFLQNWLDYYKQQQKLRHHPNCDLCEAASFGSMGNKCTCLERIRDDVKREMGGA